MDPEPAGALWEAGARIFHGFVSSRGSGVFLPPFAKPGSGPRSEGTKDPFVAFLGKIGKTTRGEIPALRGSGAPYPPHPSGIGSSAGVQALGNRIPLTQSEENPPKKSWKSFFFFFFPG